MAAALRTVWAVLRSALAWRIFAYFVLAASVPLGLTALLNYRPEAPPVTPQEGIDLAAYSKTYGTQLLVRLDAAQQALRQMRPGHLEDAAKWLVPNTVGQTLFHSVAFVQPDQTARFAPPEADLPAALWKILLARRDAARRTGAHDGALLLASGPTPEQTILALLQRTAGGRPGAERLVALLDPTYLFGERDFLPKLTELCVLRATDGLPLYCSRPDMLALAQQVVGQSGVQRADVGTWTLYAAPDLEFAPLSFVSMRVPGKNALPVRDARQTLLELALVSLLLAVGLCLALVRRTLLPLRRLMDATRRLAAGNFTQAIRVERADELGRLALSFNDMARRLDGQIQSLKAISAIDQELLGHPDIEHIVARTLPVIGALASDCAVAVARLSGDAAPSEGVPTWRWRAGVIEQLSLAIGEDEWQGWSLLRSDVQLPADAAAGSRLAAALFEGQSQDCRLIPVRGRNASITLIALGPVRLELPDPEQLAQIREIAKRLGLAFDAAAHEPVGLEDAQAGARRWLRETSEGASRAAARASGLEADLRAAIEGGEIQAHFQPRVRLEDGRVIGAEALARWPRRSQGLVAPERFIALAEQIGMIGDLGQSMLTQAVVRLGEWQRRGLPVRRVSVNVSTQQLREGSIAAQFVRIVQAAGLRAAEIELEIRQSALLPEARQVRGTLEQLRRAGFRIALDDFGTGSASLTDLRDVPIDVLKIDRRFIKDIDTSNGARASAIAIISLAQSLGIGLVAEGVETLEQENMLRAWGCHEAQGFLYARALSAPAFERYALTRPQRQAELGQTVEASVSF